MIRTLSALFALLALTPAWAQTAAPHSRANAISEPAETSIPSHSTSLPTALACCQLAAGTPLHLELVDPLNSSQNRRGDAFGLRVRKPILVDGHEVIPAGAVGIGEVVHAAAARGGGAPGELLIAARSLQVGGQTVALRGLKLGVTGGDNSGMAMGLSTAIGPFALFVRGDEIELPALTPVVAKIAATVTLPPVSATDTIPSVPPTQPE